MPNNVTFMEVPPEIDNPLILRRFLLHLIEKLDVAFGNRGNTGFVNSTGIEEAFSGQIFKNVKRYSEEFNFTSDRDLIDRGYVLNNSTNNPEQTAITDVTYNPVPGVFVVQDPVINAGISSNATKINEILIALRNADIIGV